MDQNIHLEMITWNHIIICIRYEYLKVYNCVQIIYIKLEYLVSYNCVQIIYILNNIYM